MNRFNNVEIIREIINELRNICSFSEFMKLKDNLINKLEIVEWNIRTNGKEKNDNFGEYLSKANEYISQYKPQNGYSKGYSNLFKIPTKNEDIQNYNNKDVINQKDLEIKNIYNRNENINLKNNNYQTPNKIINNSNQNNTINYSYNFNLQNNYLNKNNINNTETETPTQLSPPKKIEYNSQEIKTLFQNKNINNNNNNYNIPKFNINQNKIYQFNDNNEDNNYEPTPSLKRYLAENRNKNEYKFLSDEQLSNIKNNEKENRISNIILKINQNEEIYEILKKLFSDDLIDKIMDKNCSDNYITKIEETIKQIEILQKKDEDEITKNESIIFQTINNNENIPNQKKKLPKRAQLKTRKGNYSSNSLKKYINNNNNDNNIGYNINNSGPNILNYSQNNSMPKNKKKSYADELLLSHGLPIGKITNENNIKTIQYQPIKNRSFNK